MVQRGAVVTPRVARVLTVDLEDIQGIALHGYRRQRVARFHLVSFGDGEARRAVARLVPEVSSAAEPGARHRHNLALTISGLRALGLNDAELAQFPRELRQGMAHPERAAALADFAANSAVGWEFGGPKGPPLDALWMTFAETPEQLDALSAERERLFQRFALAWQAHDVGALAAEPALPAPRVRRSERVPWGEFILGRRDVVGERLAGPFVRVKLGARPFPEWHKRQNALDLGQNGSYLVLRKLEHAHVDPDHTQTPELSRAHRLLVRTRRHEAGSWLLALNASIRRQFEFVHQARSSGLGADESRHATRVRGGAYFFLPSMSALNYLAEPGG